MVYWGGGNFYVLGYTQIYLNEVQRNDLLWIVALGFYGLFLVGILLCFTRRKRLVYIDAVINVVLFCIGIAVISPIIRGKASGINLAGKSVTLIERIELIIKYFNQIISGKVEEIWIYGHSVTKLEYMYIVLYLVVTICVIGISVIGRRSSKHIRHFYISFAILVFYLAECMFIASRMQAQHMVPLLIVLVVSMAFGCEIIFDSIQQYSGFGLKCISSVLFALLFCINVKNVCVSVKEIRTTGGVGLYTNQLNSIAEEAKKQSRNENNSNYSAPFKIH